MNNFEGYLFFLKRGIMKYLKNSIFLLLWFSALALPAQNVDKVGLLSLYDRQFEYLDSLLKHQFVDYCVPLKEFNVNFPPPYY